MSLPIWWVELAAHGADRPALLVVGEEAIIGLFSEMGRLRHI